jgi:hypothetical protein
MLTQADSLRDTGVDITVHTFIEGEHLLDRIDFWGVVSTWLTGAD